MADIVTELREPLVMSMFATKDDLYREQEQQRAKAADEITRLRAQTQWNTDMEAAPRDGTSILTMPHYRVTHWDNDVLSVAGSGWAGSWDEYRDAYAEIKPTAWMPLPPMEGEDDELNKIADERADGPFVRVDLDELSEGE